jgi:hypothetical protein
MEFKPSTACLLNHKTGNKPRHAFLLLADFTLDVGKHDEKITGRGTTCTCHTLQEKRNGKDARIFSVEQDAPLLPTKPR